MPYKTQKTTEGRANGSCCSWLGLRWRPTVREIVSGLSLYHYRKLHCYFNAVAFNVEGCSPEFWLIALLRMIPPECTKSIKDQRIPSIRRSIGYHHRASETAQMIICSLLISPSPDAGLSQSIITPAPGSLLHIPSCAFCSKRKGTE